MIDAREFLDSVAGYSSSGTGGLKSSSEKPIRLGTIDTAYDSTASILPRIIFDGEAPRVSPKGYAWADSYTPVPGDRVYLLPVGQSYLIGGKIQMTNKVNVRYAEFYNLGFGVSGGSVSWDIGPLTKSTQLSYWGEFATAGALPGSVDILEAGFYSFHTISAPNANPGNAAVFLRTPSGMITGGDTTGYIWEIMTSAPIVRVDTPTNFRWTMTATNAHTLKSTVRIQQIAKF